MSKIFLSSQIKHFSEVSNGDSLDGTLVDEVLFTGKSAIIYYSGFRVCYSVTNIDPIAALKLNALDSIIASATKKFRYINVDITNGHIVSVLSLVLISGCRDESSIVAVDTAMSSFAKYVREEPDPGTLVDYTDDFIVYLDAEGLVKYNIRRELRKRYSVFSEFYRLKAWGTVVLSKSRIKLFNYKLATCLAIGLRAESIAPISDLAKVFEPVVRYVDKNVADDAIFNLILYVMLFSFFILLVAGSLFLILGAGVSKNHITLLMGLSGGVCGALISVLQRSKSLQVGMYESTRIIVLHGVVRVCLGCAFGVISLVACKAGLLLGLMGESNSRLLILAIVAGFSERLVPDFIAKTVGEQVSVKAVKGSE
ncbi:MULTISPECIES: hypothetical protein [unclassified Pseudomonas]|uniref:hypothetical protein n=1 Tax=unclassified Pseudomonas TaxID=196821 RepID=UPI001F5A8AE4|nr:MULTISPECIES: hypothetical protein [unclassified Pseudomonas]